MDDTEDPREAVIHEMAKELAAVKRELAELRKAGAAPTEELSEEQAIAAEADRRRQEAAREAKVRAAMDPRAQRLEFLKRYYGGNQ